MNINNTIWGKIALITDDAYMAAVISAAFIKQAHYFPIFKSPRLKRSDASNEIIRLHNALVVANPSLIIYSKTSEIISQTINKAIATENMNINSYKKAREVLELPENLFSEDKLHPAYTLYRHFVKKPESDTLVVVEDDNTSTTVIAANYAIYHKAEFIILPPLPETFPQGTIDSLNAISSVDSSHREIRQIELNNLKDSIKKQLPPKDWSKYKKILFITAGIPYHLCLENSSDIQVTYLFSLNLGQILMRNIAEAVLPTKSEDGFIGLFLGGEGISESFKDKESDYFDKAMLRGRGFVKTWKNATVEEAKADLEFFPSDIVYISTHSGQIEGRENTYEFEFNGKFHKVIIRESSNAYERIFEPVSIDDLEINTPEYLKNGLVKVHRDFSLKLMQKMSPGKLISSIDVKLNIRAFIFKSSPPNGPYVPMIFHGIASGYRPLLITNSCGSWTDISGRVSFAESSAYIGTLWPITNKEALLFAEGFFTSFLEDDLLTSFNNGKLKIPGDELSTRAYIITASFESKFDPPNVFKTDGETSLNNRINISLERLSKKIPSKHTEGGLKAWKSFLEGYKKELSKI